MYSSGLIFPAALTLNQNPLFEVALALSGSSMDSESNKAGNYTCTDYRSEMILLGLVRRLQAAAPGSRQAEDLRRQIKTLKAEMGMD